MGAYKDLTGSVFGRLTVTKRLDVKNNKIYWECKCACGKVCRVAGHRLNLKIGTRSCGCLLTEYINNQGYDMSGRKFGKIKVLHKVTATKKGDGTHWLGECECGVKRIFKLTDLTTGNTKSCGCSTGEFIREKIRLPQGESGFRRVLDSYKFSAKKRMIEFLLTEEQFKNLTKGNCYYCGAEPKQKRRDRKNSWSEYVYNGIDRLNSENKYAIDNCVTCCWVCNRAKGNMTIEEFWTWVQNIKKWSHDVLTQA